MNFICQPCRDGKHGACPGKTWCDCQHLSRRSLLARYGACVNIPDPDIFYSPAGVNAFAAKRVCAGCSVRAVCAQEAIESNDEHGIWGGLSVKERRVLRREWVERTAAEWVTALIVEVA